MAGRFTAGPAGAPERRTTATPTLPNGAPAPDAAARRRAHKPLAAPHGYGVPWAGRWQYARAATGRQPQALTQAGEAPISAASLVSVQKIMANTKSAKKAARQSARRTAVNRTRRSRLRSAVRKVEEAISAGDKSSALAAMAEAEPVIIRAARKNVVHRNAARRKVSRLAHRIAKLGKS
jgi:small subunit ribosomal protein S20